MGTPHVPLLDLKAQYASIRGEIDEAVHRVVESQHFILGPEVEALEAELAEYCGVSHCVAMSSGTDALLAALMAMEIGPGDQVITTPYSFFATAGSIARVGATPVFVDVDPATFNIDAARLESGITNRTRAIMPVHLYGQCADMEPIRRIADRHGLKVIEDAAQAIGAEYMGARAGAIGDVGCFSFFPSKNLGGFGDGGAVTTNDPDLYRKLKCIRTHGETTTYHHKLIGGNFRIDALQAAVLRVKLRHLEKWTEARQRNAAYYNRLFAERGLVGPLVKTPTSVFDRHVYNQYVVRLTDRDAVMKHLAEAGVGVRIYYPVALHMQECFARLGYRAGDMPQSEAAAAETLALPVYPELQSAQLRYVADTILGYYQSSAGRTAARAAA